MQTAHASLDNKANIFTCSPAEQINRGRSWLHKASWKHKMGLALAYQIKDFIFNNAGMELPGSWGWYKTQFMHRDDADKNTATHELARLYYQLVNTGMAVGALFKQGDTMELQAAGIYYSKHRFCPLWNWRKSQIIRRCYRKYITENMETLRKFRPIHCVLTVPHTVEGWKGKEFYGKELVQAFAKIRRQVFFKNNVEGGEYCVEVSRGKNGLHIHLHIFLLQNAAVKVGVMRRKLADAWRKVTGNKSRSSGCHYETLYYRDKTNYIQVEHYETKNFMVRDMEDFGRFPMEYEDGTIVTDENGNTVWRTEAPYVCEAEWADAPYKTSRLYNKVYITENSTPDEYLSAVLECVKYHFKGDTAVIERTEDGRPIYGIALIGDIIENSKNMRFYDRFGCFRKEEALNFSRICKDEVDDVVEIQTDESVDLSTLAVTPEGEIIEVLQQAPAEEELKGNIKEFKRNLLNPFTEEPAQPGDYQVVFFHLSKILSLARDGTHKIVNLANKGVIKETRRTFGEAFGEIIKCLREGENPCCLIE